MNNEERIERINTVRSICDLLEANPEVKLPFEVGLSSNWGIYTHSVDQFLHVVAAMTDPVIRLDDKQESIVAEQSIGHLTLRAAIQTNLISEPEKFSISRPSVAYEWSPEAIRAAAREFVPAEV